MIGKQPLVPLKRMTDYFGRLGFAAHCRRQLSANSSLGATAGLGVSKLETETKDWETHNEKIISCQKGRTKKRGWHTARERQDRQGSHGRNKMTVPVTSHGSKYVEINVLGGRNTNGDSIGGIQQTIHSGWKTRVTHSIQRIGDHVKHIHRTHNQEADHVANLGAEGVLKVIVEGFRTTTAWKATRVGTEVNTKGSSGCGIVIKAVDTES